MGLFKSKEERRMERDLQVRKGLTSIRKQIKDLERYEKDYIEKARRAKRINAADQLEFLKKAIRRTIGQRMLMERQLLAIETAAQMKGQAESYSAFAKAMTAVSKSISEVFGSMDFSRTQKDFEKAMSRAENLEQRMDIFLDTSLNTMFTEGSSVDEGIISDDELNALLEGQEKPVTHLDPQVARELEELEKQL
ncbi:MAG: hypothetical protein GHCLOJNM_00949 [bacterium]|nr:hypothetical protein [bacterium]